MPDGLFSVSDIQDYFEYIKKNQKVIDNPPTKIYINKIEKTGLTSETMELHESTKNKTTKDKNDENVPHLEITEVVLVRCNIANNNYQQNSRVLYRFTLNKSFGKLLDILPKYFIFL